MRKTTGLSQQNGTFTSSQFQASDGKINENARNIENYGGSHQNFVSYTLREYFRHAVTSLAAIGGRALQACFPAPSGFAYWSKDPGSGSGKRRRSTHFEGFYLWVSQGGATIRTKIYEQAALGGINTL